MIFHILNGDALAEIFPKSIPGERIIFRECLIDGPVNPTPTQELWQVRAEFIQQNYSGGEKVDYRKNSYEEILKIKFIPSGAKIYLWFEEDLFCQVNLWFILNYLKDHHAEVFLVLPYPDSPYHFSELKESELVDSYDTKAHALNVKEMEILARIWIHFQKEEVYEAHKIASVFQERFPFLKLAVEAWRDMIPFGDFLGKPKTVLTEIIKKSSSNDFGTIFKEFQKQLPEYGFGDLQVKRMCGELGII
ncbi:DUF1835 domain-containing protein [Algoriphagus sp. A40]|uniref:DUF1835 domain-containing protein n=1 Tax=Algoriphagus sp. A40 TaxID=1945863 RepID=UPI000985E6CD|nr:DUF1835 domain-containing protein [Algoriphagus sp. A40]OOG78128.1 hypothetical protein B0E43_03230 [Algoriphagus sp. A40]